MNEPRKKRSVLGDAADLALSVLPEISSLLSLETISDPKLALTRVGSAIVANKLNKLYTEFAARKERGKIISDLHPAQDHIIEMLRFIENNEPDAKIEAAKKLFFKSIEPGTPEAERILIFEFMQKCKKLSPNDLLVLKAAYEISEGRGKPNVFDGVDINQRYRSVWFRVVSRHLGHKLESLVESSEKTLIEEKFITPIEERSSSTYFPVGNFRLTDLGSAFCEYLTLKDFAK